MDKHQRIILNKKINNLPKYDLGTTPISSGYQRSTNSVPIGYIDQYGTNLSNEVRGQRQENVAGLVNQGAQLITQGTGLADIGKEIAKGTLGKAAGAGFSLVSAVPSAMQLHGSILSKRSFDGYDGGELDALASKNTEYANGVAYQTIGGVDSDNIMNAAKLRDTQENLGLTTSAMGVGAGIGGAIGSIVPGVGTVIGGALGAGIGALGSLFGWNSKEKREQRRRLNNFRIASNAINTQNEAVAGSQGLRNEFYTTHADEGLSPFKGAANAKVGGGEIITEHDENGDVVDAMQMPITRNTPERIDNILVHLNDNNGVLGNKTNPLTGNRFAVDGRRHMNDPVALTQLVALQDIYTDDNALYADKGLSPFRKASNEVNTQNMKIKKYDKGRYMGLMSMLPGLMEMGVGARQAYSYKKNTPMALSSYTPNEYTNAVLGLLGSLRYDPYNELQSLNDIERQAIYSYNTASMSPGQRLAMYSQLNNNKMKNRASILSQAQQLNNQYAQQYANTLMKIDEAQTARKQQARAMQNDQQSKSEAAQRKGIETGMQTGLKGAYKAFGEYSNDYWTNRNIGLWEDWIESQKQGNNSSSNNSSNNTSTNTTPIQLSFNRQPNLKMNRGTSIWLPWSWEEPSSLKKKLPRYTFGFWGINK